MYIWEFLMQSFCIEERGTDKNCNEVWNSPSRTVEFYGLIIALKETKTTFNEKSPTVGPSYNPPPFAHTANGYCRAARITIDSRTVRTKFCTATS
jgi:hypothetical protein